MDIRVYGSSAGNLGGSPTAELPDNALHLLFPPLSPTDLSSGRVEHRCVFLKNVSEDKTYFRVTVEVIQPPDGNRNPVERIYLGVDPKKGESIQQIPNSSVAPSGVTFFLNTPVEIGMLGPGEVQGIWIRREVPPNTPTGGFIKVTLRISGYSLKSS